MITYKSGHNCSETYFFTKKIDKVIYNYCKVLHDKSLINQYKLMVSNIYYIKKIVNLQRLNGKILKIVI